jgi:hypothetical protein
VSDLGRKPLAPQIHLDGDGRLVSRASDRHSDDGMVAMAKGINLREITEVSGNSAEELSKMLFNRCHVLVVSRPTIVVTQVRQSEFGVTS